MHGICQLDSITWTNPITRFTYEGICGLGGPFLTIVITVVVVLWIISKIASSSK